MRKAMLVRVFRTFVRKAFKFVKVVPVVVVSLYVQMPVLLVNFQRVEMPDERAEVVPVGYKVPALAGAVPSAADTCDEKGVLFEQAFERAREVFPVRFVLRRNFFPDHIVGNVVDARSFLALAEGFVYGLFRFVVFGV